MKIGKAILLPRFELHLMRNNFDILEHCSMTKPRVMEQDQQASNSQKSNEEPSKLGGLKAIGLGLLVLGIAYYFFTTMTSYENGEGISMNRLLLIAYKVLGKYISTGILSLIGLLFVYSGIKEVASVKK